MKGKKKNMLNSCNQNVFLWNINQLIIPQAFWLHDGTTLTRHTWSSLITQPIIIYGTYGMPMTSVEYNSGYAFTKDAPYLDLTGKIYVYINMEYLLWAFRSSEKNCSTEMWFTCIYKLLTQCKTTDMTHASLKDVETKQNSAIMFYERQDTTQYCHFFFKIIASQKSKGWWDVFLWAQSMHYVLPLHLGSCTQSCVITGNATRLICIKLDFNDHIYQLV